MGFLDGACVWSELDWPGLGPRGVIRIDSKQAGSLNRGNMFFD